MRPPLAETTKSYGHLPGDGTVRCKWKSATPSYIIGITTKNVTFPLKFFFCFIIYLSCTVWVTKCKTRLKLVTAENGDSGVFLCRSRTYDFPITSSDAPPLSYRGWLEKSDCSRTRVEPTTTFRFLVPMLYHWTAGDSWSWAIKLGCSFAGVVCSSPAKEYSDFFWVSHVNLFISFDGVNIHLIPKWPPF